MKFIVGAVFAIVVIALAVGAIRGRVRARNCCSPIPLENDARMKA